jgi:hypothetical protein
MVLTALILLAEAIVYWILRKRFYRMRWVWCHVVLLYMLLIILPGIYIFIIPLFSRDFESGSYYKWLGNLRLVRTFLYWSLLIMAHVFFVLTIVKSFSKNSSAEIGTNETSGLLDEFTG